MGKALIIVDVQVDFCEGGALAVAGGTAVAGAISRHVRESRYDEVVATRDYHVDPGGHFSSEPDYVRSWPVHCVAGTAGAAFHPELAVGPIREVFSKGRYDDGYSGFDGVDDAGTALPDWLGARGIDEVDVAGIATDHCVRVTSLAAVRAGLRTTALLALTAGISQATVDTALRDMRAAGVSLVGEPVLA